MRVIDAAAATFARHGYHGVGTRAIAENLGIKAASLYCHVASKEEALEEVCLQGIGMPVAYLRAAIASADDMAPRIRNFFRFQSSHIPSHLDYITVYLHERRHLPPDARTRVEAVSRQFRDELERLFQDAMARGELHPLLTPRSARLSMIGVIRNVHQFYIEGPIKEFDAFVADTVDVLIRGMVPAGGPLAG